MTNIGVISDTHGILDNEVKNFLKECDEIWHAGDIGSPSVIKQLEELAVVRAVYGNIDDPTIRHQYPENNIFETAGVKVYITHIGGYPGRYQPRVKKLIHKEKPDIFISGHSHILKVMHDESNHLLHLNPGAAGNAGFHRYITAIRFQITNRRFENLEVFEKSRLKVRY